MHEPQRTAFLKGKRDAGKSTGLHERQHLARPCLCNSSPRSAKKRAAGTSTCALPDSRHEAVELASRVRFLFVAK